MAEVGVKSAKAQKGETGKKAPVSSKATPEWSQSLDSSAAQVLHLQRTIGNRAVTRLIKTGALQAKLSIRTGRDRMVQRAQIGRINTPAGGGQPHFIYELDSTRSTFSQLASYYGVSVSAIQRLNPGVRANALHLGQQINVPAFNPPASGSILVGPPAPGIIQSTGTVALPLRWNSGANDNIVGRAPRGTNVGLIGAGVYISVASLQNVAQGILDEMQQLGLVFSGQVYCYLPAANVRSTLTPTSGPDVNLIARMIWGEQRNQGNNAMAAAAWIACNRFDSGWGSYSQIITQGQFHGLASTRAVTGLTGANQAAWVNAQRIAQEVVDGTIADPTGGVCYFGNGNSVLRKMQNCTRRNSSFTYGQITGTNFYYSNGDYSSTACTVP